MRLICCRRDGARMTDRWIGKVSLEKLIFGGVV
jgi:hypothetical protein